MNTCTSMRFHYFVLNDEASFNFAQHRPQRPFGLIKCIMLIIIVSNRPEGSLWDLRFWLWCSATDEARQF